MNITHVSKLTVMKKIYLNGCNYYLPQCSLLGPDYLLAKFAVLRSYFKIVPGVPVISVNSTPLNFNKY